MCRTKSVCNIFVYCSISELKFGLLENLLILIVQNLVLKLPVEMGNLIGPVWDMIKLMWAPVGRRIQLARRLGEKIEKLDTEARYLSNQRQDIERELSSDVDKVPNEVCKGWIDDVEKIEQRRSEIKDEYAQNKKCLLGLFPDIKWRMSLGKRIEEVDVRIGELKEMSKFEGGFALDLHRHLLLSKVLAHIRSEKIHQIGIWGMGGVGKTTVVKALNNLPEISITFEIVIWVTVSSQGSIDKIQKDVARRLSINVNDADPIHTVANKIYQILSSKKFLLLLDDVWRSLDLGDIGIPNLNEQEKDEEIEVDELIEYWRAEGLTGDAKSIIDGYNKGRDLLNTLVQKSLLEMVGYSRCRMHDLLRDLALIITSPRGNNDNKFLTIPNKFFQHLAELRVLDLSYTSIRSLPSSISSLVNLQGLYLNYCESLAELPSEVGSLKKLQELQMAGVGVHSLPFEIMNLNRLISFIFSSACHVSTTVDIPAGVIKSLISLEQLQIGVKLLQSAHVAMLDEVACLRNLTKIHLSFPNVENLERFLSTSWSWKEQRFLNFRFFVNNNWDPSVYPQPELSHGALILYDCQDSPTTPIPPTIMRVLSRSQEFMVSSRGIKTLSEFGMQNLKGLRICEVWSCDDIEILANGDESEGGDIFPDLENLDVELFAEIESNTGRATVNKKLLKSQFFEIGNM
ncbi:unnamed protein product [Dovyalis caffra]|uniref:Disease resistance protein n=1 Tax=Dovyalis caffra TaxID=77055 RepID=A0AAV1S435_9ROSI|nr:unnamed protein product [Dovyalis caffra]